MTAGAQTRSLVLRILCAAVIGACGGAAALIVAFGLHPAVVIEMDRDLPRGIASGFYPIERSGDLTFAWTARRADMALPHLSRTAAWSCALTLRGGRSAPADQPAVDLAVDGITVATETATNEFREIRITVPARPSRDGLELTIVSSKTIVPGRSDPRELGVQVDRLVCVPASEGLMLPPAAAIRDSALAAGTFGAAFVLAGAPLGVAAAGAAILAGGQAYPLSTGLAPYVGFAGRMLWFAAWIMALALAVLHGAERWRADPFHRAARFVVVFSAAALYLKLLGLLHPSKLLVDAVFHAHRFEWVLAGRYYFTQAMPDGVSFPYAIGLYVFAAPWSVLTRDHVVLLRVVVCAAEVVAGALLYPLIAKAWADRIAGATAVVLFSVVPLPFGLVGNANLTNAFGQSVALATLAAASLLQSGRHRFTTAAGLFLLCSLAFLSHVSTFALLLVTLSGLVLLYWLRGGLELRRTTWAILGVTTLAAVFAVVIYYGHFGEVYATALRVRADAAATTAASAQSLNRPSSAVVSLSGRIVNALTFTVAAIGWPILILGVVGVVRLWFGGFRDRAALLIGAWGIAYLVFLGVAVMRVDAPFQRYAAEFVGRVLFATYPAAVLLAAAGVGWAWRAGIVPRIASVLLLAGAVVVGVREWAGWIR